MSVVWILGNDKSLAGQNFSVSSKSCIPSMPLFYQETRCVCWVNQHVTP
jgi:hypothetical protein